jgi:uncharacterized protein
MTTSDARPLALVTGASSGIGLELAKQFAENGFDLLINAEDSRLDAAVTALGAAVSTEVRAVRADLRTPEGVEQVHAAVTATGRPLAAAALNAGVGRGGPSSTSTSTTRSRSSTSTSPPPCGWRSSCSATWPRATRAAS